MAIATGLLMAVTLAGALLAVLVRNVLHAVFGLAIALLGVAGLFFLLNSPFVATMEVLIYVGGISVAMIFVVMLSSVVGREPDESKARRGLAALVVAPFFVGIGIIISNHRFADPPAGVRDNSPEGIGVALLNQYNLAFETLSVILLIAIIGAIVIVRRNPAEPKRGSERASIAKTQSNAELDREEA